MPGPKDPNDPGYKDAVLENGHAAYHWDGTQWVQNDDDPAAHPTVTGTTVGTDFNGLFGGILDFLRPPKIYSDAPGAELNTGDADADSRQLMPLYSQLREQRKYGSGAWEDAFRQASQQAQAQASALGQSQAGVGASTAMRNIGNAQAGAAQRAAAQEEILRAQAKNNAADNMMAMNGSVAAQDATQAADVAATRQNVEQTNQALREQGKQNGVGFLNGVVGAGMSLLSDGGRVPGKAKVFGDDERNDTVPAMLSPGEIVIPRTHAHSPESAAAFVRELQKQRGVQYFDEGGSVQYATGNKGIGRADLNDVFNPFYNTQAPSVENGGLLDTRTYDASRAAQLDNADYYATPAYFTPGQPTDRRSEYEKNANVAARQAFTNDIDAANAAAMAAQRRGGPAGDILQGAVAGTQGDAAQYGDTAQASANAAQQRFSEAILKQRQLDQAVAKAKQQAAWRQTMMNAGVSLANQNTLRNLVSGVAQGVSKLSDLDWGSNDSTIAGRDAGNDKSAIDAAFDSEPSAAGDWNFGGGDTQFAAHGGVIGEDEEKRAMRFLRAINKGAA